MAESTGQEIPIIDTRTGAPQASGGSTSLFNAFYVFKYSGGVDKIDASTYASNNLKDRNGAKPNVISNPTASAIVEWAKTIPANQTNNQYTIKNSPYAWADFLFCKWYGIVPNNRLVTLRKFPIGTNDDAGVKRATPVQNIPVAQAVTWFGGPTGNDINKLWQSTWTLPWLKKDTTAKDVQGNDIVNFSTDLAKFLPAGTNPFLKQAILNVATQVDLAKSGSGLKAIAGAELEELEQKYLKGLWSDNGAFFNQIQGPVNVKNQFLIRDRGLSPAAPDANWTLIFEYRTDSYFGMSQRRVALDIIANMLALTYSDGEWLEALNVYYKKLGLKLQEDEQLLVESAYVNGVFDPDKLLEAFVEISKSRVTAIIEKGIDLAQGAAQGATNLVAAGVSSLITGDLPTTKDAYKNMDPAARSALEGAIQVELTKALAKSFPAFIQQRANVANIPTGNWHLTIGNPMNPIMRIGDIVVRSCALDFGEELGPEDFPIDLKFTVTVSPTKPRDSADIRQTFNNGRIDYVESFQGQTYDQMNTYGVENKGQAAASSGNGGEDQNLGVSTERIDQVTNWLNSRYGAGMVNDADYLKSVYFYRPKETQTVGGSS